MYRLLTDYVPEFGSLLVESGHKYKLCFDNSFSLFTKKEIKYSYKLIPIEKTNDIVMNGKVKNENEEKLKNGEKVEEEKENKQQVTG